MYRVVTYTKDRNGNRIIDPGPWLASHNEADYWADYLRMLGYRVSIERLEGKITGNHAYR